MTYQDFMTYIFMTYISKQVLERFRHLAGFHIPQFDHEWCLMCRQEYEQQEQYTEEDKNETITYSEYIVYTDKLSSDHEKGLHTHSNTSLMGIYCSRCCDAGQELELQAQSDYLVEEERHGRWT